MPLTHLAVIDLEGSDLNTNPFPLRSGPHRPGSHIACILEVGLVIIDAKTLEKVVEHSWLVTPPEIFTERGFEDWVTELHENAFVYEMHTKSGLLQLLRDEYRKQPAPFETKVWPTPQKVAQDLASTLRAFVSNVEETEDGRHGLHPGNSPLMFTGNSIANYDLPLIRYWMPEVHKILSYRTYDLSVLRTHYTDLAGVELPPGLDALIKSGTGNQGRESTHRALDDARWCAEGLRQLIGYSREAGAAYKARGEA